MTKESGFGRISRWLPWRTRAEREDSAEQVIKAETEDGEGAAADREGAEFLAAEAEYSRAFENIVTGPDDLVGLLAYALFKEAVREEARQGNRTAGNSRNPTRATVEAFRMAAEQRITEVVNRGIEEATPTIQQTATNAAIASAASDLKAHVTQRTGFGMAFLTNILAWAATLAIAVMILFLANRASVEDAILGRQDAATAPNPQSTSVTTQPQAKAVNKQ